jgi:hypothetical protein
MALFCTFIVYIDAWTAINFSFMLSDYKTLFRDIAVMTKCLLALTSTNILGAGVERLLSSARDLDLVSLSINNRSGLVDAIQQNQADVVILQGDGLGDKDFLASLLTTRPGLMIIQIDANDNQLHIYQHQNLSIRHPSELIGLIQAQ